MNQVGRALSGVALEWSLRLMAGGFLRKVRSAADVADRTLAEIIAANGQSAWAREHGMAGTGPAALEAFRRLPVTSYADYAPYIDRAANGEPGVLTGDPITYFAVTSGTTGPQKLIPVTRRQHKQIMSGMLAAFGLAARAGLVGPVRGRYLQIMTEQISGVTPGGIPKGAATSGTLRSMEKMMDLIWTSPLPVIQVQNQAAARYLHLLFALGEERLWCLVAFFPSTLLATLRDLKERAPELLRDLSDGSLSPALELDPAARSALQPLLIPRPERARKLDRLLQRGRFTAREIWPEARAAFTAGSGSFRFYMEQLRPYLGSIRALSPVYAASEATVGIGLSDRPGYVTAVGTAYHEFLPPGADRPLSMAEVEPGGEYEVVLTTHAGLWRYRLGDLVRVTGRCGGAPVLEFLERRGQVINLVGEKTGEGQVSKAFIAACRDLQAQVADYVVTPDPDAIPGRYLLLAEAEPAAARGLLEALESRLQEAAPDYRDAVRMGELAPMGALVLEPGAFERYRARRVAAGASASQVKVPHVMPDPRSARQEFGPEVAVRIGFEEEALL